MAGIAIMSVAISPYARMGISNARAAHTAVPRRHQCRRLTPAQTATRHSVAGALVRKSTKSRRWTIVGSIIRLRKDGRLPGSRSLFLGGYPAEHRAEAKSSLVGSGAKRDSPPSHDECHDGNGLNSEPQGPGDTSGASEPLAYHAQNDEPGPDRRRDGPGTVGVESGHSHSPFSTSSHSSSP